MDTQLLARLPLEQARCRELAHRYASLGSVGYFAAALIEVALRRADRAIIDGHETEVRRSLQELQAFTAVGAPVAGLAMTAAPAPVPAARARGAASPNPSAQRPALVVPPRHVPPVGRRPGRELRAAA